MVKCVLESHPTAPVFDPHMPWAGRWGCSRLDQGFWRLLRGSKKNRDFQMPPTPGLHGSLPGPRPCLGSGWVRSCGWVRRSRCRSTSLLPFRQPGHLGQRLLRAPGAWATGQASLLIQEPAKCSLGGTATVGTKVRSDRDYCHSHYS